jgi:hypothetical protein
LPLFVCLLLLLTTIASASDDKTDRATLKGIKSVCVIVEVSDQASKSGVDKKALQGEIESRLHEAGIPTDPNATTCLFLDARSLQAIGAKGKPLPLFAVDFRLEFVQTVTLTRDAGAKTFAPTWSSANMAMVPAEDVRSTALEIAAALVDRFIAAYRSVNPQ